MIFRDMTKPKVVDKVKYFYILPMVSLMNDSGAIYLFLGWFHVLVMIKLMD